MSKDQPSSLSKASPLLEEVLRPVWANRIKIVLISVVVSVITFGVNFLLPVYYKSTATLLPETEKSKLSSLGQFADVAALAGVNIPGSEIARLYPSIITSETILLGVINQQFESKTFGRPITLVEYYKLDSDRPELNQEIALRKIRADLSASFDVKTSIVTVTLEMKEPELAADVLNALILQLDDFMRRKRVTSASEQVKWVEARLKQVEAELREAENVLKTFREKNRRVNDSPELLLQQERLARNVQVSTAVFIELKKQFELSKLEEIKNLSIVNILDPARPPAMKEGPKRALNTVIFFLIALLVSCSYLVLAANYGREFRSLLNAIRFPS